VSYSAYQDFGGVMFPRIIQESAGGFPSLTLTVDSFKPNASVNIQVPDPVRQARNYYFTPGPPNAPPPTPANPFSVNLSDNIMRLKLNVAQILPLHGRIVPLAELGKAIGK
jgi:hypothetical protein